MTKLETQINDIKETLSSQLSCNFSEKQIDISVKKLTEFIIYLEDIRYIIKNKKKQ